MDGHYFFELMKVLVMIEVTGILELRRKYLILVVCITNETYQIHIQINPF